MKILVLRWFVFMQRMAWFEIAILMGFVLLLQSCSQGALQQVHSKNAISSISSDGSLYVGRSLTTPLAVDTSQDSSQTLKRDFVYQLNDNAPIGSFPVQDTQGLAISPDSKHVLIGNSVGSISVWQLINQKLLYRKRVATLNDGSGATVNSVAYSPNGQWIVAAADHGPLSVLNAVDGTQRYASLDAPRASDITFSPDSLYIAASLDKAPGSIRIWRVADGVQVSDTIVAAQPRTLAFSPDGTHLALGFQSSQGGSVVLYRFDHGQLTQIASWNQTDWVYAIAFSPDGRYIAAGGAGGYGGGEWFRLFPPGESSQTTYLYQIGVPWAIKAMRLPQELSKDIAFTADGTQLVSAGGGKVISVTPYPFPIWLMPIVWFVCTLIVGIWMWVRLFGNPIKG